jgi:hypothetical protein
VTANGAIRFEAKDAVSLAIAAARGRSPALDIRHLGVLFPEMS